MPEIQIQDLLESINRDGIEKARKTADAIIADANGRAAKIIQDAQEKAAQMASEARKESESFASQGRAALRQAMNNVIISLKKEINGIFAKLIRGSLRDSMRGDSIVELAKKAMENAPNEGLTLELSDEVLDLCASKLREQLGQGLEIRANRSVRDGFRLVEKDGSGYYDFSSQELTDLVMPYLSESVSRALGGDA